MSTTNTEDMRQHFEADGSPRRLDSGTAGAHCAVATGSAIRLSIYDRRRWNPGTQNANLGLLIPRVGADMRRVADVQRLGGHHSSPNVRNLPRDENRHD